jgi:hypothetical protein
MVDRAGEVRMPLLACDRILFAALCTVRREPQLLDDLSALFLGDESPDKARALFDYLFVDTDCPAVGTNKGGVGFRLRDPMERLRHAEESGLALVTRQIR